MKKYYIIIIPLVLLVFMFLSIHATTIVPTNNFDISISDSQSIKVDFEIASVCCNDSLIFISSVYDGEIRCYDFDGTKKYTFGRTGKGPGEFAHNPSNLTIWNNYLISSDMQSFELEFFKLDGEYYTTVSYMNFMMSPVSNITQWQNQIIIEGATIDIMGNLELYHKVLVMDDKLKIKERASKLIRKIKSIKPIDLIKGINPFRIQATYFRIGNSLVKVFVNGDNEILRIYQDSDSTTISLESIPRKKVTKDVKKYYAEKSKEEFAKMGSFFKDLSDEDNIYNYPTYFPKTYLIFGIENRIFLLSRYQKTDNEINGNNNVYIFNEKSQIFETTQFPQGIPVDKIIIANKNKILLQTDKQEIRLITVGRIKYDS